MVCQRYFTSAPKEQGHGATIRQEAIRLRDAGMGVRAIARQLGVSHPSVAHWIAAEATPRPVASREHTRPVPVAHGAARHAPARAGATDWPAIELIARLVADTGRQLPARQMDALAAHRLLAAGERVGASVAGETRPAARPHTANTVSHVTQDRASIDPGPGPARPTARRPALPPSARRGFPWWAAIMLTGIALVPLLYGAATALHGTASHLPATRASLAAAATPAIVAKTPVAPSVATSIPTSVVTLPTALPATPTVTPTPVTATPTTIIPTAAEIRQRTITAETLLRAGRVTATLDYGNGTRTMTLLRFDLGDDGQVARMQVAATYQGTSGLQSIERIVIGAQAWQRQGGGAWQSITAPGNVRDQIAVYLPNVDHAPATPQVDVTGESATLRWYDAAHDMDVTVDVDPASGNPRQMTQRVRASGAMFTVTYDAWNRPVTIAAP
jgi:hypothetical protein